MLSKGLSLLILICVECENAATLVRAYEINISHSMQAKENDIIEI